MKHYLPANVLLEDWARNVFCSAVYLQLLHYYSTIRLLPRLQPRTHAFGRIPWPGNTVLSSIVILATVVLLMAYFKDFGEARALYGVIASIHVWIEIPLIAIIAGGMSTPPDVDEQTPLTNPANLPEV